MKRSGFTKPTYAEAVQRQTAKPRAVRAPLRCRSSMKRRGGKPESGSIKDLERRLDELTRRVLRQDETVSFTSGRRGTADDPLEVSHLFGRALRPTRFDCHPDGNCHMMTHSENQAHNDDKSVYQDEYIRRFGIAIFEDLNARAHSNKVFTFIELHTMITQRESMLK